LLLPFACRLLFLNVSAAGRVLRRKHLPCDARRVMLVLKRCLSISPPYIRMNGFPSAAKRVSEVLPLASRSWPPTWPFAEEDFRRRDESPDSRFYAAPRFCYHIDDAAANALTRYYSDLFGQWARPSILDLCASHLSHFPPDIAAAAGRRVALGMNASELRMNTLVDEFVVHDLNADPRLPFEDNSFDVVTNAVSIDYITQPLALCREVARVLKPGGAAVFALSNRCFPSKAVDVWLRSNDLEHVYVVGAYFHYAGGFHPPSAAEITPDQGLGPEPDGGFVQAASAWRGGASLSDAYLSVVQAKVNK
jgi:SAM-dependent methyltransferase